MQDVVEFGKQARLVCRQITFQKEGVRRAHEGNLGGNVKLLHECADFAVLLVLAAFPSSAAFDFPRQFRIWEHGEHVGTNEERVQLIEHGGRGFRTCDAAPFAVDSHEVEKRVVDARRLEAAALLQDVARGVALAHEAQRIIVAGLDADGECIRYDKNRHIAT